MKIKILFYLFIGFNIYSSYCYRCGTDLLKNNISMMNISSIGNSKRRLMDIYTPIKIKVDYKNIENQNLMKKEKLDKLKSIFSETISALSSIISVMREIIAGDITDSINQKCGINDLEPESKTGFINYDILIFPSISDSLDKNVLAAATPCLILETYKPKAGIVLINKDLALTKIDSENYMKNLLLHELTHVLGFHPIMFNGLNLVISKTIDGEQFTYINSPKVIEKAKLHFGCDNIVGIQLENQGQDGSVGSHWESRYMLGDYMISSDYSDVVISDLTLALLEDTRFYKINYYTGGLFRFGKNQGCAFLEKKCLYNKGENTLFSNEFCTVKNEPVCSGSHISKGNCYIKEYTNNINDKYRYYQERNKGGMIVTDYCPVSFILETDDGKYYYPKSCNGGKNENNNEIIGDDSMCFESSISLSEKKAICYKMSCDKTNKIINVYIGNNVITCTGNKKTLENPNGLKGEINCPDYNLICTSDIWCNDMFDCIEKKSEPDLTTYDYYSNKEALIEKDKNNLKVNDNNDFDDEDNEANNKKNMNNNNSISNFNRNSLLIYLFLLLI